MTSTPQGTGAATAALGPMTIEQGLAAFNAKHPNAKASDVVQPTLPEDEVEDLGGGVEAEAEYQEEAAPEGGETDAPEGAETEQPEAEEAPDTRPVILPDGSQITVEEARKGYLRQQDYTRKTQDVAAMRNDLVVKQDAWAQQAQKMLSDLESLNEPEPNWSELSRQHTAEEYNQIRAWWDDRSRKVNAARNAVQQAAQQKTALMKQKAVDTLLEGTYNPEWKDPAKLKAGWTSVAEYTLGLGYAPQELDVLASDPRLVVVFDKARRFDAAEGQKPVVTKSLKSKPAVVKPGARTVATPNTEAARVATDRFKTTRKLDDAVAAFNAAQAARKPIRR